MTASLSDKHIPFCLIAKLYLTPVFTPLDNSL